MIGGDKHHRNDWSSALHKRKTKRMLAIVPNTIDIIFLPFVETDNTRR